MNAFEELIGDLLQSNGYWVMQGYRIELTKEEKRRIGRPSQPSWEIDLLAYKPGDGELLIVECKSYLDSTGVSVELFAETDQPTKSRYKLFNERILRGVLFERLCNQLKQCGYIADTPKIILCLVGGRFKNEEDKGRLAAYFADKGWRLYDKEWIERELQRISTSVYTDRVSSMIAKLLLR